MTFISSSDHYSFQFCDTLTGTIITELPMGSVTFSKSLNEAGTFSGQIPVTKETKKIDLLAATIPGYCGLYILRNGVVVWGGIIWKRVYNRTSKTIQLDGSSWESWFGKRFLKQTMVFGQIEQLDIFRSLVSSAQHEGRNGFLPIDPTTNPERPDSNFLMEVDATVVSGVLRDRIYLGYDVAAIGERMKQLSAVLNGFDWQIVHDRNSDGTVVRRMIFGFPFLGKPQDQSELVYEYPGNLTDYTLSEDASDAATSVIVTGAGDGSGKIITQSSFVSWSSRFSDAGWPLLESVQNADGVTRFSTIREHLNKWESQLAPPVVITEATSKGFTFPEVGSFDPGDWAKFRIEDDLTDSLIVSFSRIFGYSVTVPDRDTEETVSLNLTEPDSYRSDDQDVPIG